MRSDRTAFSSRHPGDKAVLKSKMA